MTYESELWQKGVGVGVVFVFKILSNSQLTRTQNDKLELLV